MKDAYEQGFYACASDDSKRDNPYSPVIHSIKYYAWLAGWNDYDMNYDLDLGVF